MGSNFVSGFDRIVNAILLTAFDPGAFTSLNFTLMSVFALISVTAGQIARFLKCLYSVRFSRRILPS